jgi:hypothetical protein
VGVFLGSRQLILVGEHGPQQSLHPSPTSGIGKRSMSRTSASCTSMRHSTKRNNFGKRERSTATETR